MRILFFGMIALFCTSFLLCQAQTGSTSTLAHLSSGTLEGSIGEKGIRSFKGIPYAQAPVGALRFREPQPAFNWTGIRKADHFGPRAMQLPVFSDMMFRSAGMSEDCLYLNVWTPAKDAGQKLPVLVYFYGGGFVGGDGSEYRYDGESLARKGIVTVTVNYRLGIFGFLSHPELTRESPHHSSGNFGLMDQQEALRWVQHNIAAFGGDPKRVTIGGESAGSISVCAQMASPLSKGLFWAAIGESGALMGNIKPLELVQAEKAGVYFADSIGKKSIADLRAMPAAELLAATAKTRFPTVIDGYFLPASPAAIFAAGKQLAVNLLAGWNSAEQNYTSLLGKNEPTTESFRIAVQQIYGDKTATVLDLYKANSSEEVKQAATDLASDRFIAYSTWKWIHLHQSTSGKLVFEYLYNHPRPVAINNAASVMKASGAGHSWEIEYALGNLDSNKVYAWNHDDYMVSKTMENYFANFIKTGNPNGPGLPTWTAIKGLGSKRMVIDITPNLGEPGPIARYRFFDSMNP